MNQEIELASKEYLQSLIEYLELCHERQGKIGRPNKESLTKWKKLRHLIDKKNMKLRSLIKKDIIDRLGEPKRKEPTTNKLNENQVREIRKKFENGVTNKELSIEYKVSKSTIHEIVHRFTWKHVK